MSNVSSSKQLTYEYCLPNDRHKVKSDSIYNGVITCTREYNQTHNATREAIRESVYQSCLRVKAEKNLLTNDFDTLVQLTTHYFTESYLRTQTLFEADPQRFRTAKFYLERSVSDLLYSFSDHLAELGEVL